MPVLVYLYGLRVWVPDPRASFAVDGLRQVSLVRYTILIHLMRIGKWRVGQDEYTGHMWMSHGCHMDVTCVSS